MLKSCTSCSKRIAGSFSSSPFWSIAFIYGHMKSKSIPVCNLLKMVHNIYRVFRSGMCFSRWLKKTEIRNLHNKTRLLYYRNSPPFHFIAINLIKICHKSSKFQNSWKIGEKIYQIFFLQNQFFGENLSFWNHINIF